MVHWIQNFKECNGFEFSGRTGVELDDKAQYQWMVQQRRIGIFLGEAGEVTLETDPEDHEFCVLNEQETQEVNEILFAFGKLLFEKAQGAALPSSTRVESETAFGAWQLRDGLLEACRFEDPGAVGLGLVGGERCSLSVTDVSELVQIMARIVAHGRDRELRRDRKHES